jgi:hypothetical protein
MHSKNPGPYINSTCKCDECSQSSEDPRQAKERDNHNGSEKDRANMEGKRG